MSAHRVDSAAFEGAEESPVSSGESDAADGSPEVDETRYEVLRKLGEGGAGAVYLVRDRETGERLALKQLLRIDNKSVSRLKREFRSVADLSHPNLIRLYDLGRSANGWFITMEYLEGVDLMTYSSADRRLSLAFPAGLPPDTIQAGSAELSRTVASFQQLATGIQALHRAGMLHRDLKPSNVMVANDRVIVLDLGLVRELGDRAVTVTSDDVVAGTPAYMAPEQVTGSELTPASDWYAFGVMLYEALSGCLPFDGGLMELLRQKMEQDPTPLAQLAPDVPPQLAELCMALLRREPSQRPGHDEITSVLTSLNAQAELSVSADLDLPANDTVTRSLPDALFGRSQDMTELWQALADVQRGQFVVVHVRGTSGAGKTALISNFLDRIERQAAYADGQDVLVLRSRCYEREAMPFKALDGLIDALVHYLGHQSDVVVGHMLPVQLAELTRVFPSLERLRAVQRLISQAKPRSNAVQEREKAELALRDLIKRIVTQRPLVMWIDDLQWGDLDSASILKSWIESVEPVPVMLLLSYRSDERATSSCLAFLDDSKPATNVCVHELDLAPLRSEDVAALCAQRLGELSHHFAPLVARIVDEARGSPFFASQLLTLAQAKLAQGETDLDALSVEGIVAQASQLLSPAARRLLNVLAVAGRPTPLKLALKASAIQRDRRALLHDLRSLRLARARVVDGQQQLEVYHDRVREAVLVALDPAERTRTHQSLLAVLETSGKTDPDWLHVVALGAGDMAGARRYGLQAAERADRALAFERAAELYQKCIELGKDDPEADGGEVWLKFATALSQCRHGPRAAEAYLQAASRESPERSIELMRLAATHLVRSGHFEEGEALSAKVLAALEIDVPSSEVGLYAAIGWERARMMLRGMDFTPRAQAEASPELLARGYVYASMSIDMQSFDPLLAALFQARLLRLALDSGVPMFVSGALCAEATLACVSGSARDGERAKQLLDRAEELARDEILLRVRVLSARTICAFLQGNLAATVDLADETERLYRGPVRWEGEIAAEYYHRFAVVAARIGARIQLGQFRSAIAELRNEQHEARSTENRTANLHLSLIATVADTVEGKVDRCRERLMQERSELPKHGFGPIHLFHLGAVMWLGCATSDFAWAHSLCDDDWKRFQRSVIRRSAYLSVLAHTGHARLLLNEHVVTRARGNPASLLRSDLRALSSIPERLSRATLNYLTARLAFLAGERERAVTVLREQIVHCDGLSLRNDAEQARFALGRILGGSDGRVMCHDAEQALREMGCSDPLGTMAMHFPELCG